MRPVLLEMQGFGPFREPVAVDFSDAELIAIVGATGHGKSSIIDAICFALYGRVPRHGDNLAPVITLNAAEAKVSLTFTLGPRRYVASRIARRNPGGGGAKTRAVRLEAVHDDGSTDVLAGAVREFEPQMRALLGLDFDQFTKCVVLPQGRFAAFLQSTSGERSAILGALIGLSRYERMGHAARDRAIELQAKRAAFEQERDRATALDADVEELRRRRDALARLVTEAEGGRDTDNALAQRIEECRREAASAEAARAALAEVRIPKELASFAASAAAAEAARRTAEADSIAADEHAAETADALEQLPALEVLTAALDAHAGRASLAERIESGTGMHEQLVADGATARDALVTAEAAVVGAETAADAAGRAHAHADLRRSLVAGEPCPVCEQVVTKLPGALSTTAADRARKDLERARRAAKAAEKNASDVLAQLNRAEVQLDSLRERLVELDTAVTAHPDQDALAKLADEVRLQREAAAAARTEAAKRRAALGEATRAAERAAQKIAAGEQSFGRQRDALIRVHLEPPPDADVGTGLAERWGALESWAADARAATEKRTQLATEQLASFRAEREQLVGDLAARAMGAGAEVPDDLAVAELATALTGAHRDAVHAVEDAERRAMRRAELDRDIRAARDDEQVARTLGQLLDRTHFRRWIVDEALRGLVERASEVFRQLSSGQYSLGVTDDSDLLVIDHANADETRPVNSLSGGETFQASLALALALAERVAELAGDDAEPLESIFLDEGFGSLDPETLDVVAGTIESLARADRVVGVVTHVRELADRMPVRLRVRKESGTSVVTREET
jgi:exonuclease SbcC